MVFTVASRIGIFMGELEGYISHKFLGFPKINKHNRGSRLKLVQVPTLQNEASAAEGAQVGNRGSSTKAKLIGRHIEYRSKKHSV